MVGENATTLHICCCKKKSFEIYLILFSLLNNECRKKNQISVIIHNKCFSFINLLYYNVCGLHKWLRFCIYTFYDWKLDERKIFYMLEILSLMMY